MPIKSGKKLKKMNRTIDLNSDLGEGFGPYKIGNDEEILDYVSSANIACGYHAGDHNIMNSTVKMAKEKGVAVGAHPGLPDRLGFGRRDMKMEPHDVYNLVTYQVAALQGFCNIHDVALRHVKPHGALYNMAAKNARMAESIAQAVFDFNPDLLLFGLSGSELIKAGDKAGLGTISEVFADRTYQPDGSLTPRSNKNAMITDTTEAANQVIRMITEGKVTALDGSRSAIKAQTVCVHGDGPKALHFVSELEKELTKNGISIVCAGLANG